MQKRRFSVLLAGLVTSAALGLAMPASAQPYQDEYKLSTVLGEAFPWGWGAKRWADLVAVARKAAMDAMKRDKAETTRKRRDDLAGQLGLDL